MYGLPKTVRFAESDFSGVAAGIMGGRVPHFPKNQFWDLSKSDEKSVRLPKGVPLNAFDLA